MAPMSPHIYKEIELVKSNSLQHLQNIHELFNPLFPFSTIYLNAHFHRIQLTVNRQTMDMAEYGSNKKPELSH